jgi:hypothetical protein
MDLDCRFCGLEYPHGQLCCPHCGRPMLYPNVQAAEAQAERSALAAMYAKAVKWAADHAVEDVARAFESRVAASHAVINRPAGEVERLATSDRELYATYYQLTDAEIRIPPGDKWDRLRRITDELLFTGYRNGIRFAALSLDGRGLSSYGLCTLVLREEMIAHRATVFVENSVLWMKRHLVRIANDEALPEGYRALWDARSQLSVVKLCERLRPCMDPDSFPGLLLRNGPSSVEDEFVEVHVYGPITVRTVGKVVVQKPTELSILVKVEALGEMLTKYGVPLEVVS